MLTVASNPSRRPVSMVALAACATLGLGLFAASPSSAAVPHASLSQDPSAGDMYTPWLIPSGSVKARTGSPASHGSPMAQATIGSAQTDMKALLQNGHAPSAVRKLPVQLAQVGGLPSSVFSSRSSNGVAVWLLLAAVFLATAVALRAPRRRSR
jgi:hypothetical protein